MAAPADALEGALDLARFLPYRLSVLAFKVSKQLATQYAARFDITIPEWRVIAVLGQFNDVSADFVCGKTEMDRVTVSRAIAKLLGKRYIRRRFLREDRRHSVLNLAAGGRRIYEQIVPMARRYENALITGLSAAERQQLDMLLVALEKQIGAATHALNAQAHPE